MRLFQHIAAFHLLQRIDPTRRGRIGFATGSVVAILVAVGVFATAQYTEAEPFPTPAATTTTTVDTASDNTFGGTSDNTVANTDAQTTNSVATTSTNGSYAALGDSVAAGLGLPILANATDQDRACGRSSQSYAYEVGRQLDKTVALLACSGATAGDLLTQQRINGSNPQAQIRAAYANGAPSLITITAGANDSRWQTFITKCYASTCGTKSDTKLASGALTLMQAKLIAAMESIRIRAIASKTEAPRVVLTGYYDPFSDECLTNPVASGRLTQNELTWLGGSVDALNETISNVAARYGFARFASVDFSGHDVCSADPWIQGLSDTAPIHPTADGQQAIAQSIIASTR